MNESLPKSSSGNINGVILMNKKDLKEQLQFFSDEFHISMYTQTYIQVNCKLNLNNHNQETHSLA